MTEEERKKNEERKKEERADRNRHPFHNRTHTNSLLFACVENPHSHHVRSFFPLYMWRRLCSRHSSYNLQSVGIKANTGERWVGLGVEVGGREDSRLRAWCVQVHGRGGGGANLRWTREAANTAPLGLAQAHCSFLAGGGGFQDGEGDPVAGGGRRGGAVAVVLAVLVIAIESLSLSYPLLLSLPVSSVPVECVSASVLFRCLSSFPFLCVRLSLRAGLFSCIVAVSRCPCLCAFWS